MMRRREVLVVVAGAAAVWGTGLLAVPGAASAWAAQAAHGTVTGWGDRPLGSGDRGARTGGAEQGRRTPGRYGLCRAARRVPSARPEELTRNQHKQGFVVLERERPVGQGDPGTRPRVAEAGATPTWCRCRAARRAVARPQGVTATAPVTAKGFVTGEKNGVWSKAVEVPGLAALNTGGKARRQPGVGAPRGSKLRGRRDIHRRRRPCAGLRGQREERLAGARAIEVPGLGALNVGGSAGVSAVSCASAGDLHGPGGDYADGVIAPIRSVTSRDSSPPRRTATGARRSRRPAWAPLMRVGTPRS